MNPYIVPVCCAICGGEAVATPKQSVSQWYGGDLVHRDPSVCQYYLDRKARRVAIEKIEIAERIVAMYPAGTPENEQTLANTVNDLVKGTPVVDLDLRDY